MAKIKFKLKAMRSITVRALNGKRYNLKAGMNSFELEYSDYTALLKALGMKPAPEKKEPEPAKHIEQPVLKDAEPVKAEPAPEEPAKIEVHISEPEIDEGPKSETDQSDESDSHAEVLEDESEQEILADEAMPTEESTPDDSRQEARTKEIDYASMSYIKLKAEYKRITGKHCKLKKDELIQFLQEQRDV